MSQAYWLSQVFSAAAIALGVSAYLQRKEIRLKLMLSGAAACQAVHFVLLGATQGAFQTSLTSFRFLVSAWRQSDAFFWVFILLGVALGIWKYRSPIDLLPVLANSIACYAVFRLHGLAMRCWLLVVTLCWFVYNAWNLSIVGCVLELTYASMNLLAMRNHRRGGGAS
jgi:hypothetical protein